MADIQAKIIVRQGAFAQLPKLASGEMAFANDVRRLFIGNNPISRTGDGTTTEFTFGVDLDRVNGQYFMDIDGNSTTDFTVDNFTVTFNTAPADGAVITLTYNSEVMLTTPPEGIIDLPQNASLLEGPQTALAIPSIAIDSDRFGNAKIRYTLTNGTAYRRGVLSIAFMNGTFTIHDDYTTTADITTTNLDHEFNGAFTGTNFVLNYTTNDPVPTQLTWTEDHFAVAAS